MCGLHAAQPRLQTLGKPPHRECRQLANRLVSRVSRRRCRRLFLCALQQRPQQRRAPQVLRCRGGVLRVFQGSVCSLYERMLCMWLPSTGACCDAWTPQGTMPPATAPKTRINSSTETYLAEGGIGGAGRQSLRLRGVHAIAAAVAAAHARARRAGRRKAWQDTAGCVCDQRVSQR